MKTIKHSLLNFLVLILLLAICLPVYAETVQTDGQAPERWLSDGALTTAEAAVARGKELFFSAYLDQPIDPLSVSAVETEGGWQVEAVEGEARLALLLSRDGQLLQYDNSACPLPPLTDGAPFLEEAESAAYGMDVSIAVDDMFRALIGSGFDAVCCYAVDDGVYFYRFNEIQAYAAIRLEPTLRLLAFGDLRAPDARYGSCLSAREAEKAARAALAVTYGLSQEEAVQLYLRQFDFAVTADRWTDAAVPTPYWFFVLNESEGFSGGDYTVLNESEDCSGGDYTALIDATTGETLEVHDPSTSGKG